MLAQMWGLLAFVLVLCTLSVQSQPKYPRKHKPFRRGRPVPYGDDDDKIWLFAVSGRRKPFNYLSNEGELVGFTVDFVNAVCTEARKKCSMTLAQFTECTFTDRNINYPGRGLMAEWFDACPGYGVTVDRRNGFDFTLPFLNTDASFSVLPGNPSGFNASAADFSNFTITHLTGAGTNANCLNRIGRKFGNITIAANLPDARKLLETRQADVLFSPRNNITGLETLPERVHCDVSGTAVMVKKGSSLPRWWNPAFLRWVRRGGYDRFCKQAKDKYQYDFDCMTGKPPIRRRPYFPLRSFVDSVAWFSAKM
ncbi:uncharacterized protein LOC126819789 [Patella vulgata]|uniref:uncharacterized protein LOC126819789 n=1 Tax=Patella vulgata TaxID=6465 RepID=UPI0024A963F2|nr:uncharacterized protein LOC126819789 [Patella vulgata]